MASQDDVRRIALSLPETTEDPNGFTFFVAGKPFAWSWLERGRPETGAPTERRGHRCQSRERVREGEPHGHGPNFLGTTDIVAATTITGDAVCRSTNVVYRLDTGAARTFLAQYVALP